MSAAMLTTLRPRSRRSMSIGTVVGIVVCAAALAGSAFIAAHTSRGSKGADQSALRAQLVSWEAALHPAVLSASQVVALGPRQGVSEVANRTQPMAQLRTEAIGWHARLTVLAGQIAALQPPQFLQMAQGLLNQAMTGYVNAAHSLLLAVPAHGARRTSLLVAATADGKAADHLYDEAVASIATWRLQLGLTSDWSSS